MDPEKPINPFESDDAEEMVTRAGETVVPTPPADADDLVPDDGATLVASRKPRLPEKIGNYRPKRMLGVGGMGAVYEAVQDGTGRTVALKVMREGMMSRSLLRRFKYESQILARLKHPGIAQVYDAGTFDDGSGAVPYFAMEHVEDAKTLTEFVDDTKLADDQRLELFTHVCEAVHHGHQKGIIHRDLKPDNILVDLEGQPKIIDFGIARVTDSDIAVTTSHTQVGDLIGTLQYMSPEQCEADPDDLDTRSDVYSLGVVLYELLCGALPYDVTGVKIYDATRIVRDSLPTPLRQIRSELQGDVETIALKALEKDRERRYQSALELANDIRRYLDDEAISARPPSLAYQTLRFARRHKALVTGIAAVFATLVIGLIASTIGFVQARQNAAAARESEAIARQEASTSKAITSYLQDMFSSLDARDGIGHDVRVADLLDKSTADLDADLDEQPEVLAALRWSIGNAYKSLALYDKAEPQLRQALATRREVLPAPHPDVAQTAEDLASVLWFKRTNPEEVESLYRETLDLRRQIYGEEHEEVASSLNYLAASLSLQQRYGESEDLYRQALAMRTRLHGPQSELVSRSTNNLAACLMQQKRYDEAVPLFRTATDLVKANRGEKHIDVAGGLSNLARCLVETGEADEAESAFEQALQIKRDRLGDDHASVSITYHHLARLMVRTQRWDKAEVFCREALRIRDLRYQDGDRRIASSARLLSEILDARGLAQEAERVRSEYELSSG